MVFIPIFMNRIQSFRFWFVRVWADEVIDHPDRGRGAAA